MAESGRRARPGKKKIEAYDHPDNKRANDPHVGLVVSSRLAKNLKAEIDPERIEANRGTVSIPFEPGEHGRVAVKIQDDRGIESLGRPEVAE